MSWSRTINVCGPKVGWVPISVVVVVATLAFPSTATAQDSLRGAELFRTATCSQCHGADALGGQGPRLAGTGLSGEAIRAQVRNPRDAMPTFSEQRLSPADLDDIVAWLTSSQVAAVDYPTWYTTDLINLPTPPAVEPKTLEVHFGHRFSRSISDAGREGLWGLDSFAFPSFIFAFGIVDRISAYGGRTSNFATWEYGAKIALLTEDDSPLPIAIGASIGGTYLDFDLVENNSRFTAEIPVGVRVHDRLSLLAVPFFATGSDHPDDPDSDGNAAALGLGGSFRMTPRLSVDFEWIKNVAGYERTDSMSQWQAMLGIRAGGHVFQVGVTNSVWYTPDFMAGGALDTEMDSEVRLGFNLVRAFTFGDGGDG